MLLVINFIFMVFGCVATRIICTKVPVKHRYIGGFFVGMFLGVAACVLSALETGII